MYRNTRGGDACMHGEWAGGTAVMVAREQLALEARTTVLGAWLLLGSVRVLLQCQRVDLSLRVPACPACVPGGLWQQPLSRAGTHGSPFL